jgi:hypothetical protein
MPTTSGLRRQDRLATGNAVSRREQPIAATARLQHEHAPGDLLQRQRLRDGAAATPAGAGVVAPLHAGAGDRRLFSARRPKRSDRENTDRQGGFTTCVQPTPVDFHADTIVLNSTTTRAAQRR